jgi:TetR/AcrR family transcriptional repressor of nem operon
MYLCVTWTAPMPKQAFKLTSKGQQTRQRIVEAADRLITRQGMIRVTLDDVRAEAQVSNSQIYHYFADKHSLFAAVVDYQYARSAGRASMQGEFDSADAVRSWGERLVEQQRATRFVGGCPIATIATGLLGIDNGTLGQLSQLFDSCEDSIRSGYRAMHANKKFEPGVDPEALATMTLATAIGGLVLTQINRDARPLQAALEALVDCLETRQSIAPNRLAAG